MQLSQSLSVIWYTAYLQSTFVVQTQQMTLFMCKCLCASGSKSTIIYGTYRLTTAERDAKCRELVLSAVLDSFQGLLSTA